MGVAFWLCPVVFSKMNSDVSSVLESGRISLNLSRQQFSAGSELQQVSWPLLCTLWGTCEIAGNRKVRSQLTPDTELLQSQRVNVRK